MANAKTSSRTVLSIRMSDVEMATLSAAAERSGQSVSEFAREALRRSVGSKWSLNVFDARGGFAVAPSAPTGGEYSRQVVGTA